MTTQIERTVERMMERDDQPTVEEWLQYLRVGNAVRIPLKTTNYSSPYYAWREDGRIAVTRSGTAVSYHSEDEGYVRQMLGFYNPVPIEMDEIPR